VHFVHAAYWTQYAIRAIIIDETEALILGKTSSKVKDRYNAKAYDEIKVRVTKGKKDIIKAHAAARGASVNDFINRAIDEKIDRDGEGNA